MKALELKIPPVVIVAATGALMKGVSVLLPMDALPSALNAILLWSFFGIGLSFFVAAAVAFRRAQTTVNPMAPGDASQLVQGGVFRLTRNPMYVGFILLLAAWAFRIGSLPSLMFVPLCVAYLTRFQVIPEERALTQLFPDYAAYRQRVSRWLFF